VLTVGRQKRSELYNLFIDAETPEFLVPRRRRYGITERIAADANGGDWIIPTVLFPDGSIEINPSREDVSQRLAELSQT